MLAGKGCLGNIDVLICRKHGPVAESDRERWNTKYSGKSDLVLNPPDDWLRQHASSLSAGKALDLACGLGHNAIWLAQHGWQVDAVDISPVGLELAKRLADQGLCRSINWIAADLDSYEVTAASCDLAIVFRFLDRVRLPALIDDALRPGGILIYETFASGQLARSDSHLKNPQFALQPNELPALFPRFAVMSYEEVDLADRSVARLVARKPMV